MKKKDNCKILNSTQGGLYYYRDYDDSEGAIVMVNPKTIKKYEEIKNQHPDSDKYAIFFAFSNEQFAEGVKKLKDAGFIKSEKELRSYDNSGLFGTQQGINDFFAFYKERNKRIAKECDPQEVYFYEWNNHECMFSWDGDKEPFMLIQQYFGSKIAESITRI